MRAGRQLGPLLYLFLFACGHAQVKRQYPAPAAEELLTALHARQDFARGLNLQTRTTSWLGGDRVRATVLMLVQRPGKLRFEAEVSLKGTVAALTTDGATFALLDMDRNEFRQGPACPQNVATLVRIPLAPPQIAAILLGDAPTTPGSRLVASAWDAGSGAEVLKFTTPGAREPTQLHVYMQKQTQGWAVVAVQGNAMNAKGKQGWWRVRYEDLTFVDGVYFPNVIRFAEPDADFDNGVEIKIKDRRINPTLTDDNFHLSPPPDVLIQNVNCGGV